MKILSCLASVNCFISLLTRCPENVDRYPKMWINARKCGSIPENVDKLPKMRINSQNPENVESQSKRHNNFLSKKQAECHISVWSTGGEDSSGTAVAAQWFYSTNQNVSKELQLSTVIFLLASDNESLSNLVTYRVTDSTDTGLKLKCAKLHLKVAPRHVHL